MPLAWVRFPSLRFFVKLINGNIRGGNPEYDVSSVAIGLMKDINTAVSDKPREPQDGRDRMSGHWPKSIPPSISLPFGFGGRASETGGVSIPEVRAMKEHESDNSKTVVITGATAGIGLAAAKRLAGLGCRVIGAGRDAGRCGEAVAAIREAVPGARVTYLVADLASQREVRALAGEIRRLLETENDGRLDVLINNAGAVTTWYTATEDGYETQFAVNHLAPFLLTRELLPLLQRSPLARVLTTSSGSHYGARMHWRDVMYRRGYNCLAAYKQSKLANVLFTHEMNRRLAASTNIRAYAVDPGLVNTAIGEKGTGGLVRWFWRIRRRGGASPDEAARTIVYLATAPVLADPEASYWKDCRPKRPSRYSEREAEARRLWEMSERLCGEVSP